MMTNSAEATAERGTIVNDRVTKQYRVASAPALKQYHDKLFGGVDVDAGMDADINADADADAAQLCVAMKELVGHAAKGCETAAAFTTWQVVLEPDAVYDAAGARRRVDVRVKALVAVPQWEAVHAASAGDAAEARRFEHQTLLHEEGHALSGENAAASIRAFLDALPAAVAPADVAAYNDAARRVAYDFYVAAAHAADKLYDNVTDHGRVQGAEALADIAEGKPLPVLSRPTLPKRAKVTASRRPALRLV
jgi:hypothetical protein